MKYRSGIVKEIPKDVDRTRTIPFIISSGARDRHRTRVNMRNWQIDNYNRNPIVGYQHDVYGAGFFYPDNPDTVIGYSKISFDGDYMIGHATFETESINPLAERIFKKVKFGSLRSASVGFIEIGTGKYGTGTEAKGGQNETYYFEGQELLEWSVVKIPSNPEAVTQNTGSRSKKEMAMQLIQSRMKQQSPKVYGEMLLQEAEKLKYSNPKEYRRKRFEALKYMYQ